MIHTPETNQKRKQLIDTMRTLSTELFSEEELTIPDDCEKYGFVEGNHNLGTMLHFLADMM